MIIYAVWNILLPDDYICNFFLLFLLFPLDQLLNFTKKTKIYDTGAKCRSELAFSRCSSRMIHLQLYLHG